MKIVFLRVISLILILLSNYSINEKSENEMLYRDGIFHDKNWEESIGTYFGDVIPDKETALAIANVIFQGMEVSTASRNMVPQSVFYDESDEVWIVSFWKDTDEMILGEDCSIAMQKKDGKVLRIWFGE